MSKNAKIAVIVSVLAVIVLLVVLSSTVFSVRKANLVWYNTPTGTLANLSNNMVLKSSKLEANSVFLLDKNKAIENLEEKYPDMRIIDIEICWPNEVKIHAIQRQEVYAIRVANGRIAIMDEYFKVLNVVSAFSSTKTNAILLNTNEYENKYVSKADQVDIFGSKVYTDIYTAFMELGRNLADMRAIIANAEITETTLTLNTHFNSKILLAQPFANTTAKMRLALKTFDMCTAEDYKNSTIQVFVNNRDLLESRFIKE
ncbi:MAG: hypothetical protein J6C13_02940 [Clostridia bacterium]|nr:hypothetical protein [Clostridia bacterium]